MQLDANRNISKVETTLKENIGEVRKQVDKLREDLEDRIEDIGSKPSRPGEGGISHEKMNAINNQFTKIT